MSSERGDSDRYLTASGIPLRGWYGPEDVPSPAREAGAGSPGVPPYVRGAYPGMYRTKPWRVFQLSGHGNPEDERERILFLLSQGETGFIMEHDRNTADHLYNVDNPEVVARREDVGQTGAVIQSVRDYETILDGIDMGHYYAHPGGAVVQHAPFALGCYWTVARRRGPGPFQAFRHRAERLLPHLPGLHPQTPDSHRSRDPPQHRHHRVLRTLSASMGPGVDRRLQRGRHRTERLPGTRRPVRQRGGVPGRDQPADSREPDTPGLHGRRNKPAGGDGLLRGHLQDASRPEDVGRGCCGVGTESRTPAPPGFGSTSSPPDRPLLTSSLSTTSPGEPSWRWPRCWGGTQSLGVATYDEAMSIPSEHAHQMSLRIQQIIHHETNLPAVADPLGGSHYVEALTAELETRAWEMFEEIENRGGFAAVLDEGWLHDLAAGNQLDLADAVNRGDRKMVGVNAFVEDVISMGDDWLRTSGGEFGNSQWKDCGWCGGNGTAGRPPRL